MAVVAPSAAAAGVTATNGTGVSVRPSSSATTASSMSGADAAALLVGSQPGHAQLGRPRPQFGVVAAAVG